MSWSGPTYQKIYFDRECDEDYFELYVRSLLKKKLVRLLAVTYLQRN